MVNRTRRRGRHQGKALRGPTAQQLFCQYLDRFPLLKGQPPGIGALTRLRLTTRNPVSRSWIWHWGCRRHVGLAPLRLRVGLVMDGTLTAGWSAVDVARRWVRLFPVRELGEVDEDVCRLLAQLRSPHKRSACGAVGRRTPKGRMKSACGPPPLLRLRPCGPTLRTNDEAWRAAREKRGEERVFRFTS
jgi:hypothetical protein